MLNCLQKARSLYIENGFDVEAVQTLLTPIYIAVERGELDNARQMMHLYETKSNLFDGQGNIVDGREVYYYAKGLYYLKLNMFDSSETFMRKLLLSDQEANAYRGLLRLYSKEGIIDSVSKYAILFEDATDKMNNHRETEAIKRASALYDYHHSERLALIKSIEAGRLKQAVVIILLISFFIISALLVFFQRAKEQKEKAMAQYMVNVKQLREVRKEIVALRQHERENEAIIAKREDDFALLEKQIAKYRQSAAQKPSSDGSPSIEQTNIYTYFHVLANKGQKPSAEDWEELHLAFKQYLPQTYNFINGHLHDMDTTACHVCLLVRIKIKPTPISHMTGVTDAYISLVRKELLKKFFSINGKPKEFDSRIQEMN